MPLKSYVKYYPDTDITELKYSEEINDFKNRLEDVIARVKERGYFNKSALKLNECVQMCIIQFVVINRVY